MQESKTESDSKDMLKTTGSITMDFSAEMMNMIKESLVIYLRSHPEFVKEILNEAFQTSSEEVRLKSVHKEVAQKMITEFINKNPGCKTSDMIIQLELEPTLVMETLKELERVGSVLSKPIEQ